MPRRNAIKITQATRSVAPDVEAPVASGETGAPASSAPVWPTAASSPVARPESHARIVGLARQEGLVGSVHLAVHLVAQEARVVTKGGSRSSVEIAVTGTRAIVAHAVKSVSSSPR